MLGLPTGYDGQLRVIDINCNSVETHGPHVFYMLLDELEKELNGYPTKNKQVIHYREILLQAYTDGRLFGLSVDQTSSGDDSGSLFMAGLQNLRVLPSFCIADACDITDDPAVDFIWTAIRARNIGLATYLLDSLQITRVTDPLDDDDVYWAKYLTLSSSPAKHSPICLPRRTDTGQTDAGSYMQQSMFCGGHGVTDGVEV